MKRKRDYSDIAGQQLEIQQERKIPLASDTDTIPITNTDDTLIQSTDNTLIIDTDKNNDGISINQTKRKTKQVTLTIDVGSKELKEHWIKKARDEGETVSALFKKYMLKKYGRP